MKKMIETLRNIGLPDNEIIRIVDYYKDDTNSVTQYMTFIRAMFDDRHEYI